MVRSRAGLVTATPAGTGFTDETCEVWDSTGALVDFNRTHRFRHTVVICTASVGMRYVGSAA